LFHGRAWGDWVLDAERLTLVFRGKSTEWGGDDIPKFTVYLSHVYEIDLERFGTSAQALDWLFQIRTKSWASARVLMDLLNAIHSIVDPQANLCSGGGSKKIADIQTFLQERFMPVGGDA
jgi:hypothetical protein